MKRITLAASLVVVPALAGAQASVQAQSRTSVEAAAATSAAPAGGEGKLSADAQSRIDANLRAARERKLPEEPIRRRVAEGEAKGASEAQIVASSGKVLADLQGSFDAMVRAGRPAPSEQEVSRGAQLMARGYTSAQIEGIAHKAPADRSLVVAFETLTSLQAQGRSTSSAVAQLSTLLEARASDAELRGVAASGSAGANATAGVTHAPAGAAAGVTGSAAATVGGVLGRKP